MTGKVLAIGPGFVATAEYLVRDGRELAAWTSEGVLSLASAGMEMEAIAAMDGKVEGDPNRLMLHFTIGWAPHEVPSIDEMLSVSVRAVAALGFGDAVRSDDVPGSEREVMTWTLRGEHQVVVILHNDSTIRHYHAHVVVNRRARESGKIVSVRDPYGKLDLALRSLEVAYGRTASAGIYRAVATETGVELVRHDRSERGKPLVSPAARDAEIQSGLPAFGPWLDARTGADIREILDDPDAGQYELHVALGRWDAQIVKYRDGHVIVDRKDARKRVAAAAIDPRLAATPFGARFGLLDVPGNLEPAQTDYARDIRRFAPNSARDEYESRLRSWRESPAGRAHHTALRELADRAREERKRLRDEHARSVEAALDGPRPGLAIDLASVLYTARMTALQVAARDETEALRQAAIAAGRPARTFFRSQSVEQSGGDVRAFGGNGATGAAPPPLSGYDLRPGPRSADYLRGRLRVIAAGATAVQVLSDDPRDARAAADVARSLYREPIVAQGDPDFIRTARTLGIVPAARRLTPTSN